MDAKTIIMNYFAFHSQNNPNLALAIDLEINAYILLIDKLSPSFSWAEFSLILVLSII